MGLLNDEFSYDEARAVHDNDQYELENDRVQQQQVPDWDDDDSDLLNPNLPGSAAAPQVCFIFIKTISNKITF